MAAKGRGGGATVTGDIPGLCPVWEMTSSLSLHL